MNPNQEKTLLLTLEYPPVVGGVSRYYATLVKYFGEDRLKVLSLGLTWAGWPRWLPAVFKTLLALKNDKYKRLFIGQVLPLGYVALIIKKLCQKNFVVFVHGMDILLPQQNKWKKWWLKKILKEAEEIIANSNFTKTELLKLGLVDNKIKIVYPCIESITKNQEILKENDIILGVGRMVSRKGFDLVIKAMPQILSKIPQAQLVLIGDGPEKNKLVQIIKDLKLERQVTLLSKVGDAELQNWFKKSNVFIMPCHQNGADVEGLGTVFLEAASYGLPIVVGNSGGAPEAVINLETGFLVNPNSLEEISEALIKILSDTNKAHAMGEAGRKMVEEKFLCSKQLSKITI